jgi:hypothetical protein
MIFKKSIINLSIPDNSTSELCKNKKNDNMKVITNGQITYSIKKHKAYYALSEIRRLIHGRIVPAKPNNNPKQNKP